MDFNDAYNAMKKGKKVKCKNNIISFGDDRLILENVNNTLEDINRDMVTLLDDVFSNDWEIYEESKWKPSLGDLYYYINSNGDIKFSYYNTRSIDKRCIGNFFKTDEEADHMVEKLKVIKELKELSNIKFNMSDYLKNNKIYYIAYDFTQNRIVPLFDNISRNIPFNVYFSTKEDCEKAITKIGKERLERYYFDIED